MIVSPKRIKSDDHNTSESFGLIEEYATIIPNPIDNEKKICHAADNRTALDLSNVQSLLARNSNPKLAHGRVTTLSISIVKNTNGSVAENRTIFHTDFALLRVATYSKIQTIMVVISTDGTICHHQSAGVALNSSTVV